MRYGFSRFTALAICFVCALCFSVGLVRAGDIALVEGNSSSVIVATPNYETKSEALAQAKQRLEELRTKVPWDVDIQISLLRHELKEAGNVSLEQLGFSEQKLAELARKSYIHEAKKRLTNLRENDDVDVGNTLSLISIYLNKAHVSLGYIGSSSKEIALIRKHGHLVAALRYRRELQGATSRLHKETIAWLLRYELTEGGFSSEDIGIDKNELDKLAGPAEVNENVGGSTKRFRPSGHMGIDYDNVNTNVIPIE